MKLVKLTDDVRSNSMITIQVGDTKGKSKLIRIRDISIFLEFISVVSPQYLFSTFKIGWQIIQENDTTNLVFKTKKTLLQNHMLINTANINNQEIANPGVYQAITRKRSKKEINDETILNRSRFRLSRKRNVRRKSNGKEYNKYQDNSVLQVKNMQMRYKKEILILMAYDKGGIRTGSCIVLESLTYISRPKKTIGDIYSSSTSVHLMELHQLLPL
ncbi:hypothetical protein RIR_jg11499.t1 [Rhizophagus irregularis DAOM 181602=DAOM 197198]|nr:hypothetical protein RIR_jg11499.t1 [Rhizophagus irregularis DAOM 181602=DAOM 197198]